MKRIALAMLVVAIFELPLGGQSGNDLFQKALSKERVDGALTEAIALYERIVTDFAADRALAAKALVQIGRCYERLGRADAQGLYERVLREFADQNVSASVARERLSALTRSTMLRTISLGVRRVWGGPDAQFFGSPSHDGRYLSFVDWNTRDLAIREVATGSRRRLTNSSAESGGGNALYSRFSPDGSEIVFTWFADDGTSDLRVVRTDGRQQRVVYRNRDVSYVQPFDWSANGDRVLVLMTSPDRTNRIAVLFLADRSMRVLKSIAWRQPTAMNFSPDGKWIAYDLPQGDDGPERDVFAMATDGSRETRLIDHPADDVLFGWAPDGKSVLFVSDRTATRGAWTVPVANGTAVGVPTLVRSDIGAQVYPLGFTRNGAFYYYVAVAMSDVYIATLDESNASAVMATPLLGGRVVGENDSADWSSDGRHLAVVSQRTGMRDRRLVIHSVDTGGRRELAPDLGAFTAPRWSPDGRSILVYGIDRRNQYGFFRLGIETGSATRLWRFDTGTHGSRPEWTADGTGVFYVRKDAACSCVMRRDVGSGDEREIFRMPPSDLQVRHAPSPDGRSVAVLYSDHGRPTLRVVPVTGGEGRVLVSGNSLAWLTFVSWSPDSAQLFYGTDKGNDAIEVWRISVTGGIPRSTGLSMAALRNLRVHPDTRRVVFTAGQLKEEVWVMENFLSAAPGASKSPR